MSFEVKETLHSIIYEVQQLEWETTRKLFDRMMEDYKSPASVKLHSLTTKMGQDTLAVYDEAKARVDEWLETTTWDPDKETSYEARRRIDRYKSQTDTKAQAQIDRINQRYSREVAPHQAEQDIIDATKALYEFRSAPAFDDLLAGHLVKIINLLTAALVDPEFDTTWLSVPAIQVADKKKLEQLTTRVLGIIQSDRTFAISRTPDLMKSPFAKAFYFPVHFDIPRQYFLEHTMAVAGSGFGKTQLLYYLLYRWFQKDTPAIVILDSTGEIVKHVERLQIFAPGGALAGRLRIIDPARKPLPKFGLFTAHDVTAQNELTHLLTYVFTSADTPVTALQSGPFAFCVRLLLTIPGANLDTFKSLLQDRPDNYRNSKFREAIDALPETPEYRPVAEFFKTQFYDKNKAGTKDQLLTRINVIEKNPVLHPILNSRVHALDWFNELNSGSIIVVNTSAHVLKDEMPLFGRYIIALVLAAAFQRPSGNRRETFLVIDEAADYFDETFEKLLTRIRQFGLGVVMAFQDFAQLHPAKLKEIVASCTTIKFAGGVNAADARLLAGNMHCDADFILNQRRDEHPPKWSNFACYVRNMPPHRAVSAHLPFFNLHRMPVMTDAEYEALWAENVRRLSPPEPVPPPVQEPEPVWEHRPTPRAAAPKPTPENNPAFMLSDLE